MPAGSVTASRDAVVPVPMERPLSPSNDEDDLMKSEGDCRRQSRFGMSRTIHRRSGVTGRRVFVAGALLGGLAGWVAAPTVLCAQRAGPVVVTWTPDPPVQGSLFTVRVITPKEAGVVAVRAILEGEPLHFTVTGNGIREALAAIPIGVDTEVTLPLMLIRLNGRTDTIRTRVAVQTGDYRLERLTVAPRFGAPPDSATQARIRSEQQKAAAVSRQSHSTPRLWDGTVVRPRDTRVTSRFGDGREFNGQVQSRHMGLDLAGTEGAPVKAAARGVVALVDEFYLAGNVVYLDHGAGLISAYFHLSRQDVAAGDTVEAGQVIGRVGATGRVTGPHLHWVVRYGSITVSPLSLLEFGRTAASPPLQRTMIVPTMNGCGVQW